MKYLGKFGEYRVLAHLLELDIEAYLAIRTNQHDYDITAVLATNNVARIQVKTTELHNKSTNNAIDRVDKNYDFLVVVVVGEQQATSFYVMTKSDVIVAKGTLKQLGITCQRKSQFCVKDDIKIFEGEWEKIRSFQSASAQ